jgi:hypothetical protein
MYAHRTGVFAPPSYRFVSYAERGLDEKGRPLAR